jgi:citrate synthase
MSEFIEGFLEKVRKDEYRIDNELYSKYDVKKGLRNEDGTGVLVGLTKISDVVVIKGLMVKKLTVKGSYIIGELMLAILLIKENRIKDFYLKRHVF